MGQQQLLLLVVGVIIVAVAVVVGINQFGQAADQGAQDNVIQAMQHIGTQAISYYKKPTSYGGGNGSFTGYTVPDTLTKVGTNTIDGSGFPTLICTLDNDVVVTGTVTVGGTSISITP